MVLHRTNPGLARTGPHHRQVLRDRLGDHIPDGRCRASGRPYGSHQEQPTASFTTGPDGALWFTLVHSGRIGRLVPGEKPTSHRLAPDCGPTVITPGPDGALWFTQYRADRIGRITTDGVIDEFGIPTLGCGPFGIAAGPDGALWFTETAADRIGRITVTGHITEFPLPVTGAFPSAITASDDGGMWFALNQANAIGRIDMDGAVTLHPLPTQAAAPVGIAAGRDGALWFVEIAAGQIGRITPDGQITEFPLLDRTARPHAVTVDGDGIAWFTEWGWQPRRHDHPRRFPHRPRPAHPSLRTARHCPRPRRSPVDRTGYRRTRPHRPSGQHHLTKLPVDSLALFTNRHS